MLPTAMTLGATQRPISMNAPARKMVVVSAKSTDKWSGLGTDYSDDQQDISRGRNMVDPTFQVGLFHNGDPPVECD